MLRRPPSALSPPPPSLDPDDVRAFYEHVRTHRAGGDRFIRRVLNQSVTGTDKVNAILNWHLATARIGRPGMGPFSLTGQPNAMGGREVGGLANQLAAHMTFASEDVDRVRRFWKAPAIAGKPGMKAVDMFEAIHDGRIKAVWIAATNPADSMPRASRVREALEKCPLVVVADAWPTDTTRLRGCRAARRGLGREGWYGHQFGTLHFAPASVPRRAGIARPDWWMFTEVARRMGWGDAFPYQAPAEIFREHAALSAFENGGARLFDLGGLCDLDDSGYDAMPPVQWPVPRHGRGGERTAAVRTWRLFHA